MSDTFWNGYILGASLGIFGTSIMHIVWDMVVAHRERKREQ